MNYYSNSRSNKHHRVRLSGVPTIIT